MHRQVLNLQSVEVRLFIKIHDLYTSERLCLYILRLYTIIIFLRMLYLDKNTFEMGYSNM
jgi:hypothetical protein